MRTDLDIKAVRKTLEMTQVELASALGVDQGSISKWEQGHTSPRGSARILIEQLLANKRAPKKASAA